MPEIKVAFICGPYRAETPRGIVENIRRAEAVALDYWQKGYAVICPHLNTALFDGALRDEVWLEGDLELLRRSDLVVALPGWGKSKGSMCELIEAWKQGKPVVFWGEM